MVPLFRLKHDYSLSSALYQEINLILWQGKEIMQKSKNF